MCYGFLPWVGTNIIKVFEGLNAHIEFMVWLLSNVIDYTKDSRSNSRFINIFTFNGTYKELPQLLIALVQIVGRDAHFIGDMGKLKVIWYENVRFYDLTNYFDGKEFSYYWDEWV